MPSSRIALFWPGDGRSKPNELAAPNITQATVQLERALKKLGRDAYRVDGFIAKPSDAITKLSPINDPMIGVCVHWIFGPHTTDGVVGKDNPLLLASNFSGTWPGLVGLLNTSACLDSLGRRHSRIWTDVEDWCTDDVFMERLSQWCRDGTVKYRDDCLVAPPPISEKAQALALAVKQGIERRRILIMMLGDTSMGMINGYFGPRVLNKHGFTEHKVDQAWILNWGQRVSSARIEAAFRQVSGAGVTFHWREGDAHDFNEDSTKEQLRDYLAVLDLLQEYEADCLGWQYQLGLSALRPPSDFAEGLLNSVCRPESNGDTVACATEADQGNVVPMELMKRLLKAKGLHQGVMFHDVRWGHEHAGRFLWVLLNSGSCGAYAFNHDPNTLQGVHSYRQAAMYFPFPGGTFAGESLPGELTWARAYLHEGELGMDIGRGRCVKLPPDVRDSWWNGTNRQWPLMVADLGASREELMAHYRSNHIAVAYGNIFEEMVALCQMLGLKVRVWANR
jgi:L-fucose isomerase-like protein